MMRAQRTFLLLSVVVAVLLMAVAYAAISNVTLNITGNVAATADQGNFKVAFTGTPSYTRASGTSSTATATMTASGQTATMNVSGMQTAGDTVVITYSIKNSSSDIGALLSATRTVSNTTYFSVSTSFGSTDLPAGNTTTLTVTVKLIKTPLSNVSSTVTVNITASPYAYGSGNTIGGNTIY